MSDPSTLESKIVTKAVDPRILSGVAQTRAHLWYTRMDDRVDSDDHSIMCMFQHVLCEILLFDY